MFKAAFFLLLAAAICVGAPMFTLWLGGALGFWPAALLIGSVNFVFHVAKAIIAFRSAALRGAGR